MGRKIKAVDAATGKQIEADEDQIRSGRIRNTSLPQPLLDRVRAVHSKIRHVYSLPLESFEIPFMRDREPEREVRVWESIAAGFEKVTAKMPELDQKMVLRTLLGYSMDSLTPEELADPAIKKIVKMIDKGDSGK